MMSEAILEMQHIAKAFSGIYALKDAQLTLHKGSVMALVGENGAGKSTLMRILTGIYDHDGGTILYKGQPVHFKNAMQAREAGIAIIHQEFNLFPNLTVAENIFLGDKSTQVHGLVNWAAMYRRAQELVDSIGGTFSVQEKVQALSVQDQQMVEIVKALAANAEVLIMDEPTSGLDPLIQQAFYDILKEENSRGATVFFSSHVLSEVQKLCDRVAILKEGQLIGIQSIKELRESGYKKVSLSAKEAIPRDFFDLSGIANYAETADKTSVSFMYNGNITAIIDKLHLLHLDDVLLEEPSLEEIFMHYYA